MDPRFVALYYLCSIAGFVMVVGGIWLVYKQKIYIDRESKQVTEIETPIGKFKTNLPALVLFALGFVPLIYPIVESRRFAEQVRIRGSVKSDVHPVFVYAATRSDALREDREFKFSVPRVRAVGEDYKVIYVAGETVVDDQVDLAESASGEIVLEPMVITDSGVTEFEGHIEAVPEEFR